MIKVDQIENLYYVSFTGKPTQFNTYINKIMSVEDKTYDTDRKRWVFNEKSIQEIYRAFEPKRKEKPDVIASSSSAKKKVSNYEYIGSSLKLSPYDYQKEAIKYIIDTKEVLSVLPCGAGKTCIGIGAYEELRKSGEVTKPGMIIVKASLKIQWDKEVQKFSHLRSKVINTSSEATSSIKSKIKRREAKLAKATDTSAKKELQKEIIALKKEAREAFRSQFQDADLFILNYETLKDKKVQEELKKQGVEYVFADEVQYIKSKDSKRSIAVAEFADAKYKIGATATPVGKNPVDLFGILRFVAPEVFPSWGKFSSSFVKYGGFGKVVGFKNMNQLRKKIEPNLFVKSKQEVASFLPSLVVMQKYCELTPAQQQMNTTIMERLDELKEQEKSIRARLVSEKDAINNPELQKVEALILAHQTFAQQLANDEGLFLSSESELSKSFITGSKSNKMELLLELVEEIISSGEKVAIFSRFKKMQDLLLTYFHKEFPDVKVATVHGELSSKERYEQAYTKFRDDDDYRILLLSNAGAEGLNLSKCKYLIEIEPAESYGIQTQRHGRIERSDSTHDTVFVYQLIANDSWDEIALKIVSKKQGYDTDLIRKTE